MLQTSVCSYKNTRYLKRKRPVIHLAQPSKDVFLHFMLVMGNYAALFSKVGNASPKCHFVTYYSHFRVLGKRAKISVLNRGKRDLEIGNFDY